MDERSVNVRKIMSEIVREAEGITAEGDMPDFNDVPDVGSGSQEAAVMEDKIERLRLKLEETETKLFFAVRQMEVMNSRITELEKALGKKDGGV